MADDKTNTDPSLIERWLAEQQQWQRTFLTYMDSMVKNDDFLVHLGNALRGSLLAGKAYPTQPPPSGSAPETPSDDRLDQILFAVRRLEGEVHDLKLTLAEIKGEWKQVPKKTRPPRPREPQ